MMQNVTNSQIENLIKEGQSFEEKKDLESAFSCYEKAANLGAGEAAFAIAMLYLHKQFRQVEDPSGIMKKILSGAPVMPWDMVSKKMPDYKQVLQWLEFGAEHKHADSCLLLGLMLCSGEECKKDIVRGVTYLESAAANGIERAKIALDIFKPNEENFIPDEEYELLLKEFEQAVPEDLEKHAALYARLKSGSEKQRARLGYVLMKYKWLGVNLPYPLEIRDNGIPYYPVAPRRGSWETFVRIDMDAFPTADVLLAFSSDTLSFKNIETNRLKYAGEAVYLSPSFGWLGEEKHAKLFKIVPDSLIDETKLQNIINRFRLQPPEYEGNTAFMVEHGEKEYSVEIAAIYDDQVDILYRYTIGGSDKVREYRKPELKELHLV